MSPFFLFYLFIGKTYLHKTLVANKLNQINIGCHVYICRVYVLGIQLYFIVMSIHGFYMLYIYVHFFFFNGQWFHLIHLDLQGLFPFEATWQPVFHFSLLLILLSLFFVLVEPCYVINNQVHNFTDCDNTRTQQQTQIAT